MTETSPIDQNRFRRILARNITVPLVTGFLNAALFLVLILYLSSVFNKVQSTEEVIRRAGEVARMSLDMQTGLRGFLLTGDESFLQPRRQALPVFEEELADLKSLVADNPVQADRIDALQALHQEWNEYAQTVIDLRRAGGDFQPVVEERGNGGRQQIRQYFENFQDDERTLLIERNDNAQSAAVVSGVSYLLVSILLTGALTLIGRRELIVLSDTYRGAYGRLQEQTVALEHHSWHQTGQARLAEECSGQVALPILGRKVLDFLAQYMNAAVAVMYVRDGETATFTRTAAYGFAGDGDSVPQSVGDSQSLVEQAAFSNRLIKLDDVPADYLKVNSGLGNTSPRTILLLPIRHDQAPNGVLELGFLAPPTAREMEFLNSVADYIGNTVQMLLNRNRLQDALEETQQLNEELQAQQEELRSANEELEEQSRALEESQSLLENQKAELEQANDQLTEQTSLLDQRNLALNEVQSELEKRADELEQASHYKSEFLANMSHELRTPLNSSMILAKLLSDNQKGNLDEEQVQFARSIYSSGNDLLNLINDILDISKVEAGKLELHPEQVGLERLIDSMRMTFEPLAEQKQLEFLVQVAPDIPRSIYTDHKRTEQILKNLLSNAIKFTEKGRIDLAVRNGKDGQIEFSVSDTGVGIPEDQQSLIFDAFEQADGSISRRYGGTGLGLSISRDLAALLGGSISVSSVKGKGSTFTLTLPIEMPATERVESPSLSTSSQAQQQSVEGELVEGAGFAGEGTQETSDAKNSVNLFLDDRDKAAGERRTVLVVEDDPEFAHILYDLAHELNYRCLVALTAADGLQMAEDDQPDAILLDIRLPDVSGMSVLQKLKTNSATRHIPVHIVSASDRSEAAMQLGAVGYAVKPAPRDRLKQVFQKLEGKLSQKTKKVLLVEDDPVQRDAVVKLISDEDVTITAVERGEEALQHLQDSLFDCMIIDLKLPDMQGHELLQQMSTADLCSFPPVIVYTGRNLTRDEEDELLRYSRSIIIKGARSPERLLDEVTLFLHKVESELSPERQGMLKTVRGRDRALEGRRILLVDDDIRNVFALTGALEQKGAVIEVARDGYEAIEKLNRVADIELVLMDIMMPGMDGLEATRRIRADARFSKLPIIAITAKAMKDDQEQCMKAGASDYMAKPIDIDRLYSLVRVWIPSVERL